MTQKFTILFDLDGTLVDTAPDLMNAHNHVMRKFGYETKSTDDIRKLVGQGAGSLIGRSVWGQAKKELKKINDDKIKKEMVTEFIDFYGKNIANESKLINGAYDFLKWCKENLNNEIIQLAPAPNGRLRDYNFDLIIGVSVMSHLSSANQIDWLKELYDALNDDGILILSFHGISSAIRSMSEELFLEYYKFGFLDLRENRSLKEILPDHKGYRDVYNTIGFIEEHWCDAFQIIKIYESIIGNSQDLVVLAK